ncbi:MAG TPA: MFS transporter [Anaerolineales bacterium]|jgi:MFS family permease
MINSTANFSTRLKDVYEEYPRQFWLVAFGVLLSSAGSSMIWPFQLIYISKTLALPLSSAATLIAISSVTGLLVSVLGGAIADRFGRKLIMFTAQAAHGLAYILMSHAGTYAGFIVPMTIMGAAMPFYAVGSDAMMADIIPSEKRSGAIAILRMTNNAGIAIGPAIGGIVVASSYTTAFYLAAAGMFAYSLLLLTSVRETLKRTGDVSQPLSEMLTGYFRVLSDGGFMTFVSAITIGMIAPLMMWTLLAVYMNKYYAIPEYLYSWLPVTNALMCVFVQYPVTMLSRRLRAKTAIALGMLVYALGVGSVVIMSGFWGFWFSMVVMTFGELILVPTGSKYVADIAPQQLRGRYMGIYWLTWGFARSAAPIAGGYLHDSISPQAIWWGGLAIGLFSTLILFALSRQPDQSLLPAPAD